MGPWQRTPSRGSAGSRGGEGAEGGVGDISHEAYLCRIGLRACGFGGLLTLQFDFLHSLIIRADLASEGFQRTLHFVVPTEGFLIALPFRWPRAKGQRRCFSGTAGAHMAERHLHLASPLCTVCCVQLERLPRARNRVSTHFVRVLNADEMVGTGPLRMARTQKNEVVSPVGSFTNGEQR